MWTWYLDRSAGLVAYVGLWLAVLTGIFYEAHGLPWLSAAARRIHLPASFFAIAVILLHVGLGAWDAAAVFLHRVPTPGYGLAYLWIALGVGAGGFLALFTGILGFLDARRFRRPWDPRTVHLFTYGGFALASVHAVAAGTDMTRFATAGIVAGTVLVGAALLARFTSNRVSTRPKARPADPAPGP